jgi:hypothetical protein
MTAEERFERLVDESSGLSWSALSREALDHAAEARSAR